MPAPVAPEQGRRQWQQHLGDRFSQVLLTTLRKRQGNGDAIQGLVTVDDIQSGDNIPCQATDAFGGGRWQQNVLGRQVLRDQCIVHPDADTQQAWLPVCQHQAVLFHGLRQYFIVVTTEPVIGTKNHQQMPGCIVRSQGNLAGPVGKR